MIRGKLVVEVRIVVLLGLAWGFAFFDRMAMNFLAPWVAADLHLSNLEIGALSSSLGISWALSAYVIGRWSDLAGHRKPFLLCMMVVFAFCSVLSGLAWNYGSLLASRIVMGAAEGPFLPICLTILLSSSAPERHGLYSGIMQSGFGSLLGLALAPVIVVALAVSNGWRMAFMLAALPSFVLALLVWRYVAEPASTAVPASTTPGRHWLPLALFGNRNIPLLCLISMCMIGSMILSSTFLPLWFVNRRHFSPMTMSGLMAVLGICPIVGGILVPWLSDLVGRRLPMIIFCSLTALAPLAAIYFDGPAYVLGGIMFISWIGVGVGSLCIGVIPSESLPPHLKSTAMGLILGVGELTGGLIGPLVGGWAADRSGLTMPLMLQAGLAISAGLLSMALIETHPLKASTAPTP